MTDIAFIQVSPTYSLPAIIGAAGGDQSAAFYEGGRLYVPGITQSALDTALAGYNPAAHAAPVPATVTAAQARIALLRAGKLDAVKAAVTAAGGEVEIWFDYATAWERQNQHVLDLGSEIELTPQQIDGLFTEAASIAGLASSSSSSRPSSTICSSVFSFGSGVPGTTSGACAFVMPIRASVVSLLMLVSLVVLKTG